MAKTKVQPLFKWAGSKQRMLDAYSPHFWGWENKADSFVDLFAGGLTMGFWAKEKNALLPLVLNDNNQELVQLYQDLVSNPDAVTAVWEARVAEWLALPVSERKEYYYSLREIYCQDFKNQTSEYLSGLLLFMLPVGFNGLWKAYIKCNRRYSTPPGTCTQEKSFFDAKRKNIKDVVEILQGATILCQDFRAVPHSDKAFLYADPPYRDSIVEYNNSFSEKDQEDLAALLMEHHTRGGFFAYSNKYTTDGWYEQHFPGVNHILIDNTFTAGRGANKTKVQEILVTNF